MPDDHLPIVSATITLRFNDGCTHTYDIHDGAEIIVDLSDRTGHDPGEHPYADAIRYRLPSEELRMELRARAGMATMAGDPFVSLTKTGPDGEPRP